jgi:hypothetical protein
MGEGLTRGLGTEVRVKAEGFGNGQVGLDVVERGARALILPEHHKVRGQLQGHIPTPVQSGCAGVQGGRGGEGLASVRHRDRYLARYRSRSTRMHLWHTG